MEESGGGEPSSESALQSQEVPKVGNEASAGDVIPTHGVEQHDSFGCQRVKHSPSRVERVSRVIRIQ
jgi:hypothetical protein